MTVNINLTPNQIVIHGDTRVTHSFGEVRSVRRHHPPGHDIIRIEHANHLLIAYTVAHAIALYRQMGEAFVTTQAWPDCAGACVDIEKLQGLA